MANRTFTEDINMLRSIARDNLLSFDQVVEIYKIRTLAEISEALYHTDPNVNIHLITDDFSGRHQETPF